MPLYKQRNGDEQVRTVAGSREDHRLHLSDAWQLVEHDQADPPAPPDVESPDVDVADTP